MAKMKDFFGIASNGFNHTVRNSRHEDRNGDRSLIEMLEKHGTPKEKQTIKELRRAGKLSVDGKSLATKPRPAHFDINPWQ
jgi:hypothetical protein